MGERRLGPAVATTIVVALLAGCAARDTDATRSSDPTTAPRSDSPSTARAGPSVTAAEPDSAPPLPAPIDGDPDLVPVRLVSVGLDDDRATLLVDWNVDAPDAPQQRLNGGAGLPVREVTGWSPCCHFSEGVLSALGARGGPVYWVDVDGDEIVAMARRVQAERYVGVEAGDAFQIAEQQGIAVRVVEADGVPQDIDDDYHSSRLNLSIDEGVVSEAHYG